MSEVRRPARESLIYRSAPMSCSVRTPQELRDTLMQILVGAAGGDEARWREAVGEVEELSLAFDMIELGYPRPALKATGNDR